MGGFSINTRNMKRIHSFEDAKAHWESTPQGRGAGWTESERPLDNPRQHHKRLELRDDGGYACILYSTALVTYYPEDVMVRIYPSMSSGAFLGCVLPPGIDRHGRRFDHYWLRVQAPGGEEYFAQGSEPLKFFRMGDKWALQSAPAAFSQVELDIGLASKVRAKLRPFQIWYEATTKLTGIQNAPSWKVPTAAVERLFQAPTVTDLYPDAATVIHDIPDLWSRAYDHFGARRTKSVPAGQLPTRGAQVVSRARP